MYNLKTGHIILNLSFREAKAKLVLVFLKGQQSYKVLGKER